MVEMLLGEYNPKLTNAESQYLPIGIVLRDEDNIEVRLVDPDILPEGYKPEHPFSIELFGAMDKVFRNAKETKPGYPVSLVFSRLEYAVRGTLQEQADQLFEKEVLSYYV